MPPPSLLSSIIMRPLFLTATLCVLLTSSSNLRADHHELSTKVKTNKAMVTMFFDKILSKPEELKAICHEDFTFTYMGKIPKEFTLLEYGKAYNADDFFSSWLDHVGKVVPDGIELNTLHMIADEKGVAVRQKGKAKGKYAQYNNDYSWHFLFKDGKIHSIEEFNSDVLVAKALYGRVLRKRDPEAQKAKHLRSLTFMAYETFASGDSEGWAKLHTDDLKFTVFGDLPQSGVKIGTDTVIEEVFKVIPAHWKNFKVKPVRTDVIGNKVFVNVKITADNLDSESMHVFSIKGGKISSFTAFDDTDLMRKAMIK